MLPEPHFQELARILRRRILFVLALGVLGATLAGIGGLIIKPRYTAKAQILYEPKQANFLTGPAAPEVAQPVDESAIQTVVTALNSRDLRERVVGRLSEDRDLRAALLNAQTKTSAIGDFLPEFKHVWTRLGGFIPTSWPIGSGFQNPKVTAHAGNKAPADPVGNEINRLRIDELERLTVYQESASHVVAVSFTSTSPGEAAAVVNRVARLYVEGQTEQKRMNTTSALTWLGERIPELKAECERAEAAVQIYQSLHGIADTDRSDVIDQHIAELNRQLVAAQSDLTARRERLDRIHDLQRHGVDVGSLVNSLNLPRLDELRRQELALLQSAAELATTFGETHPKIRQIRGQLDVVRRRTAHELDQAVRNLENEADVVSGQVHSIQQRLARVQTTSSDAGLRDLKRRAAATRQRYENLLQRREELHEQQESLVPDVRILSLASPPDRPSSPNPILFVFPAFVVSLIGGGLLALIQEQLDENLRSQREVSDALGIPCIALVPQLRGIGSTRPHQYLLAKPYAAYTEAIRAVFATVQLGPWNRAAKVILVSSSVPGEGKTTLAVSFAIYAALLDRRVLLVDLDFRRPAILRELGKAEDEILDLLIHNHPSEDAIQHLAEPRLDYLPVRRRPFDPLQLFASGQMSRLLAQLRSTYDCVVIDSPPLLAITEARLLTSMVDKVIFVVKWASTRRDLARNALGTLRGSGPLDKDFGDLAVAVMTQVNLKKHARYRYGDAGEYFVKYEQETLPG